MWKVTIKGLWAKKLRLLLTSLSVVIGVAFVAGSFVLTDTISSIFDSIFQSAYANVDVAVRSTVKLPTVNQGGGGYEQRATVPASLVPELTSKVSDIVAAGRYVNRQALIFNHGKDIQNGGAPTLGNVWGPDPELDSVFQLQQGRRPTSGSDVAIDSQTANDNDIHVGDRLRIAFKKAPERTFRVSGIFRFGQAGNLAGATISLFDPVTAHEVLSPDADAFDIIAVRSTAGAPVAKTLAAVRAQLPPKTEAVTGTALAEEDANQLQENLSFFSTFLLVFAAISVGVGIFIIYNTFSIIVQQRSRELALLRAIGASGRQVRRSVGIEAFVTGVLSSVIGIVAGVGLATLLRWGIGLTGAKIPSGPTQLLGRTIVVSFAVGVIVTFVSAIFPARRAAKVPPVAAMRDQEFQIGGRGRSRYVAGTIATVLGAFLLVQGITGGDALQIGAAAVLIVFIGVPSLSPLIARPFVRLVGAAPARYDGITGDLARENAMRNPRRTTATAAALMIGLALVSLVTIASSSIKSTFDSVLDDTVTSDFFAQPTTRGQDAGFPTTVVEKLRAHASTAHAVGFRVGGWYDRSQLKFLLATDGRYLDTNFNLKMESGSADALKDGGVLIYKDVAKEHGYRVGDSLPMRFLNATSPVVSVPIVGVFGENRGLGSNYVLSLRDFEQQYPSQWQVDRFAAIKVPKGQSPEDARAFVKKLAGQYGLKIQDQTAFKRDITDQLDQFVNLIFVLLAFSVLIATIGVVNTLTLSVVERTRELGLLRAVGMSLPQTRRMIRWEALVIAVFGGILGVVVGMVFGRALVVALADQGFKFALPVSSVWTILVVSAVGLVFAVLNFWKAVAAGVAVVVVAIGGNALGLGVIAFPGAALIVLAALAAIAGLVAAAWPSWRATRLNVLDAVTTE
ncbi:MAG: FtsX-like permease family protein [Acidimicrobiia bacterium]